VGGALGESPRRSIGGFFLLRRRRRHDGRPKNLRHKGWVDPEAEPFDDERDAYAPLVWQCRYSGIEVPDALWRHCTTGKGKRYSENQTEDMVAEAPFMSAFDDWADGFAQLRGWFCAQIRERARSVPRIEPALTNDARGLRIDSTVSIERIEPAKPVARRVDVIVFLHQGDRHPR
jgi:hypothetical protein